jgi:hypothetical protein
MPIVFQDVLVGDPPPFSRSPKLPSVRFYHHSDHHHAPTQSASVKREPSMWKGCHVNGCELAHLISRDVAPAMTQQLQLQNPSPSAA